MKSLVGSSSNVPHKPQVLFQKVNGISTWALFAPFHRTTNPKLDVSNWKQMENLDVKLAVCFKFVSKWNSTWWFAKEQLCVKNIHCNQNAWQQNSMSSHFEVICRQALHTLGTKTKLIRLPQNCLCFWLPHQMDETVAMSP